MGDHFGLVEPALPLLDGIQRHGNNHQARIAKERLQFGDHFRQHPAENIGGRPHLLILEQVDEIAEPALITAIGSGLRKYLLNPAAKAAERLGSVPGKGVRGNQALPANPADRASYGANSIQTGSTDREAGDSYQRGTAEPAIGRKEGGKQAFRKSGCPESNRRACGYSCGIRRPSSVLATAEDDLPRSRGMGIVIPPDETP